MSASIFSKGDKVIIIDKQNENYGKVAEVMYAGSYKPKCDLQFTNGSLTSLFDYDLKLYQQSQVRDIDPDIEKMAAVWTGPKIVMPKNNDGLSNCYKCGAITKEVEGFTSKYNICTVCGS
jgi:hypothetical protein